MSEDLDKDFQYRIHSVLDNRIQDDFRKQVGISKGMVGRMLNGEIPKCPSLAVISQIERLSLGWLMSVPRVKTPYLVYRATSDREATEQLDALLDETGWTIYILMCPIGYAVVLTQPGVIEQKGIPVNYTIVEVLAGNTGAATLQRLQQARASYPVHQMEISTKEYEALDAGTMGNQPLLGNKKYKGILSRPEIDSPLQMVADTASSYEVTPDDS